MKSAIRVFVAAAFFLLSFYLTFIPSHRLPNPEKGEDRSGAFEALQFWTASRAYPGNDIPPDRFFAAFVKQRYSSLKLSREATTPPWRFVGPVNFSGRMTSIAINPLNPSTIFTGAASGGLWRSFTGGSGSDWKRVPTGFPVLGVNAIAIDPADTNVLYLGTGEVYMYGGSVGGMLVRTTRGSYGMGILKSTDAGSTWSLSLDWSYDNQRGVQAIHINPLNTRTVYAATSEGLYRSTDGGVSWINIHNVVMAVDVVIHPVDTAKIIVSCGNFASPGAGIYYSHDAGATFTRVNTIPAFSGKSLLEVYAAHPNVVYANVADSIDGGGGLWRTTDFGISWAQVSNQTVHGVQGWYSHFVAVHPADSSKIVRGGQTAAYRSTNGGRTMTAVPDTWADLHNYAHDPKNPDILYIVDDGGVWRSDDFGLSYQYVGQGLQTSQFYNGFSNSTTDSMLALGQVQDHFGFQYSGSFDWAGGGVDEGGWTAIDPVDDRTMYAGSRGGDGIYKSTDRGLSYPSGFAGFSGAAAWNSPFAIAPSNRSVLYHARSVVWKSTNAGANWFATNGGVSLDGNPGLSITVSRTSPDTVYVGTAPLQTRAHVFRTANGGATWTNVTGILPDRYLMDLAVDPNNSAIVYAAMGGFGAGHLFKTTDAGETWTDISATLADVPGTAVVVDPFNSSHVYAGNDLGVHVSTDGGAVWTPFNDGLPEAVIVGDLTVSPSNRVLRLATHSNGVYERKLLSSQTTGIAGGREIIPLAFSLEQNFPNPFNPTTVVRYHLPAGQAGLPVASSVRLTVYDLLGREVAVLVDGREPAGIHTVRFDGSSLASGIYVYRLEILSTHGNGGFVASRKMLLIR